MMVFQLDENNFYIGFIELTEENKNNLNYTKVSIIDGYCRPRFNHETQEWIEGATEEEIKIWEEANKVESPVDGMEVLESKVKELEENQVGQDSIIDDLIFEIIPILEEQINMIQTNPLDLSNRFGNKIIKGDNAMAGYLARKIIEGRDYELVFKVYSYKQYQDEVDTILELEGRRDLIKR